MPLPLRGVTRLFAPSGPSGTRAARPLAAVLFAVSLFSAVCASESPQEDALEPTLVLVSLDGFRWDYLDRHDTPALDRIAAQGVRASKLVPVFPTETFPNHYSAVTGLYPDRHGIISNSMYDPERGAYFSLSNREAIADGRWWQGEPIWVTAEQQGQTAATYYWPGSEAAIQGVRPSYWRAFDASVPGEERVDHVFSWLELPADERPTFITLYFDELDVAGHEHGPDSREVAGAVEAVDGYVGRLLDGLEARALLDRIHLIVISDHGMAETSPERVIVLDRSFDPSQARIIRRHPVLMMYPEAGAEEATYEALRAEPHLDVYWKEDLPEHYRVEHPRTPPLIAVAEAGWSIATRDRLVDRPESFRGGSHGYDHRAPSMGGLFVAMGPSFRRGVEVDSVEIIQLYELMCGLLGLEPAPNDGRADALKHLLTTQPSPRHAEH